MESFAQSLSKLSSAEDFLVHFGVSYDERIVHVNRLHILKRFYQYLHTSDGLGGLDDVQLYRHYRAMLMKAYEDFVVSTPAQEKVFKVFQEADGMKAVPLNRLRDQLAERRRAAA
ncbi:MAG: nitrogenase stabilizing/protective protein NifW [Rubrivivax sp.]|nr:nitrogenase stabilizing/protective protein NifW [Rubrivivax sp.]